MTLIFRFMVLALAVGVTPANADNIFADGQRLLDVCQNQDHEWQKGYCDGYIDAVADAMRYLQKRADWCPPDSAVTPEMKNVVVKWLVDIPTIWRSYAGVTYVRDAIEGAWRCQR